MTEMQWAMGLVELERFESWNLPRRRRSGRYLSEQLSRNPAVLLTPTDTDERSNAYWWAPFVVDINALRVPIRLLVDAVDMRDYPVIQALVLLFSLEFILINLVVDVLYGLINPAIRYK
jgi:dTDP-4-amino-4,6-dideoxygalactose transaminase